MIGVVRRHKVLTLLTVAIVLAAGMVFAPGVVKGQTFDWWECPNRTILGRQMCRGYFTNVSNPPYNAAVLYDGLRANNVNQFISMMNNYLYSTDTRTGNGLPESLGQRNRYGAAALINSMMGVPGPDIGTSDAGLTRARNNFAQWEAIVREYDAKGQVDWSIWSTEAGVGDSGDRLLHSTGLPANRDMAFKSSMFYGTELIVFYNEDGDPIYQIERDCGNVFGEIAPLEEPSPPPEGRLNPPTPGSPGTPPGYNTGNPAVNSSCQVISGRAHDPATPGHAVQVRITFSGGATGTVNATASTSGSRAFTANTPANVRQSINPVQVAAVGIAADGEEYALDNSPITIGPCLLVNPVCDGITVTPSTIDPGTPYAINARVRYGNDLEATTVLAQPGTRFFVTINGPGVSRTINSVTPIQRSGAVLSVTTPQQPPTGQTGTYEIGYGIAGPLGAVNCGDANVNEPNPPVFPVVNLPYFRVNGGDIGAGAGLGVGGVDCAVDANPGASIVSWNRGAAGSFGGAGTQYAALALNRLQDFASGQGGALSPSGLAFANTAAGQVNHSAGIYGGKYDGLACAADYFANATNVQTGNVTIPGRTVANGTRETVYVDGNVYITGNITFSGSYANMTEVPAFSIIVRGNIYIAPGVTQLDGFYIAQPSTPSGTNGVTYTCAPVPFTSASLTRSLHGSCNTSLTVNGAFVARQVWLLRTAGTLSATPAETFNYVPELWLSAPFGNGLDAKTEDYDSITSLPPVL